MYSWNIPVLSVMPAWQEALSAALSPIVVIPNSTSCSSVNEGTSLGVTCTNYKLTLEKVAIGVQLSAANHITTMSEEVAHMSPTKWAASYSYT